MCLAGGYGQPCHIAGCAGVPPGSGGQVGGSSVNTCRKRKCTAEPSAMAVPTAPMCNAGNMKAEWNAHMRL